MRVPGFRSRSRSRRCAPGLALALLAGAAVPAEALTDGPFTPLGGQVQVNQTTSYAQKTPKVSIAPDGQYMAVAWASSVPLNDVFVRFLDAAGVPLGPEIQANPTLFLGIQDEPTVAVDRDHNTLVAWSDRNGYDGYQMGIFGRCFRADGTPWGPEFQLNVAWQQSQWEPFAIARPQGGFAVGWSGENDGDCFLRLFAGDGTPQSGDIRLNALMNNAQVCPVPSVAPDGTLFAAWIDFGGYGGVGMGTNIFARLFDQDGVPKEPVEFLVNTNSLPGEQREPKTAADGQGRFLVTWEDRQADASGIDVMVRRYDSAGQPLGPEFEANVSEAGDQVLPAIAADWVGNFVVTWQDKASGAVVARRFDAAGVPLGGEFVVHVTAPGGQSAPDVDVDPSGERFAFVYGTPDVGPVPKTEVGLQPWRFAPLVADGPLLAGGTTGLSLHLPGGGGLQRVVLLSLATSPGIALPDGRVLELAFDAVFSLVLSAPGGGGLFTGFVGPLDPAGQGAASVMLPPNAALVGIVLQGAVVTLDPAGASLAQQLRHVTHPVALPIQ